MGYTEQRAWSDRFIPEIRQLVGPHLLVPAPLDEDVREATDLIVLKARDLRVACRVRRYEYIRDYGNQFTLRSQARFGGITEYDKVVNGLGDWMFYGFADSAGEFILQWRLLDLDAFRAQLIRPETRRRIRDGEAPNGDGTRLKWFDVTSFAPKPALIIAQCEAFVGAA